MIHTTLSNFLILTTASIYNHLLYAIHSFNIRLQRCYGIENLLYTIACMSRDPPPSFISIQRLDLDTLQHVRSDRQKNTPLPVFPLTFFNVNEPCTDPKPNLSIFLTRTQTTR